MRFKFLSLMNRLEFNTIHILIKPSICLCVLKFPWKCFGDCLFTGWLVERKNENGICKLSWRSDSNLLRYIALDCAFSVKKWHESVDKVSSYMEFSIKKLGIFTTTILFCKIWIHLLQHSIRNQRWPVDRSFSTSYLNHHLQELVNLIINIFQYFDLRSPRRPLQSPCNSKHQSQPPTYFQQDIQDPILVGRTFSSRWFKLNVRLLGLKWHGSRYCDIGKPCAKYWSFSAHNFGCSIADAFNCSPNAQMLAFQLLQIMSTKKG